MTALKEWLRNEISLLSKEVQQNYTHYDDGKLFAYREALDFIEDQEKNKPKSHFCSDDKSVTFQYSNTREGVIQVLESNIDDWSKGMCIFWMVFKALALPGDMTLDAPRLAFNYYKQQKKIGNKSI
jgi:hypothetical protein